MTRAIGQSKLSKNELPGGDNEEEQDKRIIDHPCHCICDVRNCSHECGLHSLPMRLRNVRASEPLRDVPDEEGARQIVCHGKEDQPMHRKHREHQDSLVPNGANNSTDGVCRGIDRPEKEHGEANVSGPGDDDEHL